MSSSQYDKKEDTGGKLHQSHVYGARRPTVPPGVSQSSNPVAMVHAPFRDGSAERATVSSSTTVAISSARYGGVPFSNRNTSISNLALPSGNPHPNITRMPLPPQSLMQASEALSQQQHHLSTAPPVLHHAPGGVPQVLATGLLGHGSLQPMPASSQAQMQAQQQQQSQFQRLKVEDALSYLDQVKYQFGNQPQVYNDFLDIMKEFKSQSIDTPGVIARVSSLFAGHADLIVGFNTFLPPGYKIEVSGNDQVSVTGPNMIPQTINTHGPGGAGTATIQVHTPQTKYVSHPGQPQPPSHPPSLSTSQPSHGTAPSGPMFTPSGHNQSLAVTSGSTMPAVAATASTAGVPLANSNTALSTPAPGVNQQTQVGSQPVEFNHAINYVNKIKNRFQGQTDIYKAFLEILHKYQKEQRTVKETNGAYAPTLSESEVYAQVAKLFKNDEDLLREFGQFLPDAGGGIGGTSNLSALTSGSGIKADSASLDHAVAKKQNQHSVSSSVSSGGSSKLSRPAGHQSLKRPGQGLPGLTQSKKIRSCSLKDVSLAEASKHGTLGEFGFFDKVRRALSSQEVYENFLRCLLLFNNEVIGRAELVQLVQPFLMKFPELFSWFKQFLGYKEGQTGDYWNFQHGVPPQQSSTHSSQAKEKHEGMAMEIDYTTLKRLGSSYRALPGTYEQPRCGGRDTLCKEVLNDTWVSFPSWSEDSQSVTSKKTQFEEHVYRCEDERFELDVVLETNLSTILVLEAVNKKLSRMSEEEKSKFRLDNCLGGTSEVIHRKAIHRIYGDKAPDIIDGLKKNAAVAVPVVLKRLKMKDEEWREAQHQFNKVWREQNEKYYLKSLDHQGINFKQNDTRYLRSKSLINEIETLFDERQEAIENGTGNPATLQGPHMTLTYEDKSMMEDCASLIIHHVKRQTAIHKDDKQTMKTFMYQTLPDIFFAPRGNQPSDDDEDEDDENEEDEDGETKSSSRKNGKSSNSNKLKLKNRVTGGYKPGDEIDGMYHLFMCNSTFYLFFRLHEILCTRLLKIYRHAEVLAEEDAKEKRENNKQESVADLLRLKQVNDIEVDEYYSAFLEMVRNLLDGNIESAQYEDQLRDMFTIHAYTAFTMDRLVQNIVRQLQHIVQEEQCSQLLEYYQSEEKNNATGGALVSQSRRLQQELAYQRKVEQLLTEENCFKIMIIQKKTQLHVAIQLIDTEDQEEGVDPADSAKWSEYVERYANDQQDEVATDVKERLLKKPPVFMQRNARVYRQQKKSDEESDGEKQDEDGGKTKEDSETNKQNKSSRPKPRLFCSEGMVVKFTNNYKIVYGTGTGDVIYRERSLARVRLNHNARSKQLHDKFQAWVAQWERENVSRDMSRQCNNWLLGKGSSHAATPIENMNQCTTICHFEKVGLLSRNRYKVEFHPDEKPTPAAAT